MKRRLSLFVVSLACYYLVICQQISFPGAYVSDPFLLNPALIHSDGLKFNLIYKNFWSNVEGSPELYYFNFQSNIPEKPVRIALSASHETANILSTTNLGLTANYALFINSSDFLSFGLVAKLIQNQVNFGRLNSQDDHVLFQSIDKNSALEGGFGVALNTSRFVFGFAADQLFQRRLRHHNTFDNSSTIYRLLRHYTVHGRHEFQRGKYIFGHNLVFKAIQGLPLEYELLMDFSYAEALLIGVLYGSNNKVGFITNISIGDYNIGYRYDDLLASPSVINFSTHEFFFTCNWSFGKKKGTIQDKSISESKSSPEYDVAELSRLQLQYEAIKSDVEQIKSEVISEERLETKAGYSNYYVVTGTFRSLRNAKLFQKVFFRETGIETRVEKENSRGYFLVYSGVVQSVSKGKKEIKKLLKRKSQGFLMGNPWLYKKN